MNESETDEETKGKVEVCSMVLLAGTRLFPGEDAAVLSLEMGGWVDATACQPTCTFTLSLNILITTD